MSMLASEFEQLKIESCRLGSDPMIIQGAGGNTSIKDGQLMWIKASGKWLMHALDEEVFVPVNRPRLLEAFENNDPRAEKALTFVDQQLNPLSLRPSIETTLHAVMKQRVVIHVHCVDTIALAIRADASDVLYDKLREFKWAIVPYVRPGLPLSRSIAESLSADTDVLVLGNHGLVVAADDVQSCISLLDRVRVALRQTVRLVEIATHQLSSEDLGERYLPAQKQETTLLAFDDTALTVAAGGSLYPDHVIFIGEGSVFARDGETADDVCARYASRGKSEPVSIVFPGKGVAMLESASPGQQALARCLSDVCLRVGKGTVVNYLNERENDELLNWEAEQYRQTLSQP